MRWRGAIKAIRSRGRRLTLSNASDVNRAIYRLFYNPKLPRIDVRVDALTALEMQRAQTRITRIYDAADRQIIGPLAAAAVVLAGSFYLVWNWSRNERDLMLVGAAALGAWVIGKMVDMVWIRLRLLVALCRLRFKAGKLESRRAVPG